MSGSNGGLGLLSVLGIVFVVLKLVGVINWSWVLVLAPFWVPLVFLVLCFGLGALIFLLRRLFGKRK